MISTEVEQYNKIEKNPRVVVISSRTYFNLKHGKKLYKNKLHIGKENIATFFTGVVFSKRSPLKSAFNTRIVQMQESGLFKYWTSDKEDGEHEEFDQRNVKALSLSDLKSIFFLWSFGMAVATASFANELAVYLLHQQKSANQFEKTKVMTLVSKV